MDKRYKPTQKLLDAIKNETFEANAPSEIIRYVPYYDALVDINKNSVLTLAVDEDTIKTNPDYFEEVVN